MRSAHERPAWYKPIITELNEDMRQEAIEYLQGLYENGFIDFEMRRING